jgi:hypothetical protein
MENHLQRPHVYTRGPILQPCVADLEDELGTGRWLMDSDLAELDMSIIYIDTDKKAEYKSIFA